MPDAERSVELQPFAADDMDELISMVPDAGFLLQWAGPHYLFPLDRSQLEDTLAKSQGENPRVLVYKAVLRLEPAGGDQPGLGGAVAQARAGGEATVGHIQLLDIDRQYKSCVLGRVLIFPEHRGRGLGKAMVAAALQEAFGGLGLREMTLAVFDFNAPALATYRGQGFVQFDLGSHEFAGQTWTYIRMALSAREWRRRSRPGLWRRLRGRRGARLR